MTERQPQVLDYQSPAPRRASLQGWLHHLNKGEDSFLGCSALLFAVLVWVLGISGFILDAGIANCASVLLGAVSVILSLAGLLESETSKTFPLLSLGLNGVYGVVLLVGLFVR